MQCPHWLRDAIGRLPFGLHVDGRTRVRLLRCLDCLFDPPSSNVEINRSWLKVQPARDNERIVWYFSRNLVRNARRSPLFKVMSRLLPERKGVFVDVGANLGLYSYLARSLGADTMLVEPEPRHFEFLSRNTSVLGPVWPFALSDECGSARFFVGDLRHSGASSLVGTSADSHSSPYMAEVEVERITFDRMIDRVGLDAACISMLKIDVEGHERETVRGMCEYVRRGDAAPIWCEVRGPESDRGGNTCETVVNDLSDFGYRPFWWANDRFVRFNPNAATDLPRVFDILFLKSIGDAWILTGA